jgi:hypothetical protein
MCLVIFYQCQWVLSLEVFLIFSTLLGFSWSFSGLSHGIWEFQNWVHRVLICLQTFYVPHLLQSQNFVPGTCFGSDPTLGCRFPLIHHLHLHYHLVSGGKMGTLHCLCCQLKCQCIPSPLSGKRTPRNISYNNSNRIIHEWYNVFFFNFHRTLMAWHIFLLCWF